MTHLPGCADGRAYLDGTGYVCCSCAYPSPVRRYLPCAPEVADVIEAYARNLDTSVENALAVLASRLAPLEVYQRAVQK